MKLIELLNNTKCILVGLAIGTFVSGSASIYAINRMWKLDSVARGHAEFYLEQQTEFESPEIKWRWRGQYDGAIFNCPVAATNLPRHSVP